MKNRSFLNVDYERKLSLVMYYLPTFVLDI